MSRISTIYDKKVGKCLIVKGSEAYAHTTDVVLTLGTVDRNHVTTFNVPYTGNVLRDVGSSQIAFYDNGELIKIEDWSDSDSSFSGSLDLPYVTEHNIYARYLGNKECLPSRSKTLTIQEDVPSQFNTKVSFGLSPSTSFLSTVTIPVILVAPESATGSETLYYYVDGNVANKQSMTVTPNVSSNLTLSSLSNGKHTITVVFEGTNDLAESYNEIVISKGAIVDITAPSILTHSQSLFSVDFVVEDYFGDGVTQSYYLNLSFDDEEPISITEFVNNTYSINASASEITSNFHNIVFTDDSVSSATVPVTVELKDSNHTLIETFGFDLNVTRVTEFSMRVTKPYLVDNELTTITGAVNTASSVLENVAVKIGTDMVYTNSVGEFTTEFEMISQYDMSVSASCGDKTVSKTIENVLFYYDRSNLDYNTDTNLTTFIGRSNCTVGTSASPKGIRFSGTATSNSYVQFKTMVHSNMSIEFDITELINKEGTKLQGLYPFNGLKVGDHVLMTKKEIYRVALNGEWRTSYNLDGSSWFTIQFGRNGSTSRLTANKIKIKRINV